ncbi:MAG: hypothetical protein K6A35_08460 [bacterium]|nr:hypothetical protein [bacterium]
MKAKAVFVLKCLIFLIILFVILRSVNSILVPHYPIATAKYPSNGTFYQFYKMKKNSIDVLFVGSSVGVNNFISQQIYNDHGICSYNLSSEQQSVILSYYWLKEAFRYQNPKVVVLEGLFLMNFSRKSFEIINTTEGLTRKAIDPMRLSSVKIQAVSDICERDKSQDPSSYFFKNIRYHTRWKELEDIDFLPIDEQYYPCLYGWAPGLEKYKRVKFKPIVESDKCTPFELRTDMVEYFEKIVALCKENGIKLILVKIANTDFGKRKNYTYRQLAKKNGVDFYDFNEKSLYNQLKVGKGENVLHHGNLQGNLKNSALMGKILKTKYNLPSRSDDQYEKTKSIYQHVCNSFSLDKINDFNTYIRAINDPLFITFISAKDEINEAKKTDYRDVYLKVLGKDIKWETGYENASPEKGAYLAVVGKGINRKKESDPLRLDGNFDHMRNHFSMLSEGGKDVKSSKSSIIINEQEYSKNKRGLNLVVFDLVRNRVVDSVCFDTHSKELKASR